MSLDTTALSTAALGLIERLADAYEDAEVDVGMVAIVVELAEPATEDAPFGSTFITFRSNESRVWLQEALFVNAARAARAPG